MSNGANREWVDKLVTTRYRGVPSMPSPILSLQQNVIPVVYNTTTVEQFLFSYAIPGGTFTYDEMMELFMAGDLRSFAGSTTNFTFRAYLGGSIMWQATIGMVNDTDRCPYWLHAILSANQASNAQQLIGHMEIAPAIAATTGEGAFATAPSAITAILGHNNAIDMTMDQVFSVTVQMAASNAAVEATMQVAWLRK